MSLPLPLPDSRISGSHVASQRIPDDPQNPTWSLVAKGSGFDRNALREEPSRSECPTLAADPAAGDMGSVDLDGAPPDVLGIEDLW